jgi:2-polyprenyl-3-methyl-5-hydroxy-6-metoxy-1,4-benzoquinol methylase
MQTQTSTSEKIIKRYHFLTQRPDLTDDHVREVIFRAFDRNLPPFLPKEKNAAILDVACGEGGLLLYLLKKGYRNLHGFDLSTENIEICTQRFCLDFVKVWDALNIKEFEPALRFDAIFAIDIVEHLPKNAVVNFLSHCYERLADGGRLVIQTPNMGSFLGWHMRYYDITHEFGVTEKSIIDLLLAAGFEKTKICVYPSWNATTTFGYLREVYLRIIHKLIFLSEDKSRPRIPTKNLLAVART